VVGPVLAGPQYTRKMDTAKIHRRILLRGRVLNIHTVQCSTNDCSRRILGVGPSRTTLSKGPPASRLFPYIFKPYPSTPRSEPPSLQFPPGLEQSIQLILRWQAHISLQDAVILSLVTTSCTLPCSRYYIPGSPDDIIPQEADSRKLLV